MEVYLIFAVISIAIGVASNYFPNWFRSGFVTFVCYWALVLLYRLYIM